MDIVSVSVNWSAVASQAFEAKLLELTSQKEVKGMEDVVARLRAAEEMDRNKEYQQGFRAGEMWVREEARPKHLRLLEGLEDSEEGPAGSLEVFASEHEHGIAIGLYFVLHPRDEGSRQEARGFWDSILGDFGAERIEQLHFARGFVEGALAVWKAAKHKMAESK
jgi:hypothetical protein